MGVLFPPPERLKTSLSLIRQVWLCSWMICFSYAESCHLPLSRQWPGGPLAARQKLSYWDSDARFQDSPRRSPLYVFQLCRRQYCHHSEAEEAEQPRSRMRHMCTLWEINTSNTCSIDDSKLCRDPSFTLCADEQQICTVFIHVAHVWSAKSAVSLPPPPVVLSFCQTFMRICHFAVSSPGCLNSGN